MLTPAIQDAIDFLTGPDAVALFEPPLPATIDYPAIAARAGARGRDLSAQDIRRAFQIVIQARLLASRGAATGA